MAKVKLPAGPVKLHKSMAAGDSLEEAVSKTYVGSKPAKPPVSTKRR